MSKYLDMKLRTYQNKEAKDEVELKLSQIFMISQLHHVYSLYVAGIYESLNLSEKIKAGIKELYFKDKK